MAKRSAAPPERPTKAIGATRHDIAREFVSEALFIGLIGGSLGVIVGILLVSMLNGSEMLSGLVIFVTTPRLILASLFCVVLTSTVSSLYPAFRAARLMPVDALRG